MRWRLRLIVGKAFVAGLNFDAALHDTGWYQVADFVAACGCGLWVIGAIREIIREVPA